MRQAGKVQLVHVTNSLISLPLDPVQLRRAHAALHECDHNPGSYAEKVWLDAVLAAEGVVLGVLHSSLLLTPQHAHSVFSMQRVKHGEAAYRLLDLNDVASALELERQDGRVSEHMAAAKASLHVPQAQGTSVTEHYNRFSATIERLRAFDAAPSEQETVLAFLATLTGEKRTRAIELLTGRLDGPVHLSAVASALGSADVLASAVNASHYGRSARMFGTTTTPTARPAILNIASRSADSPETRSNVADTVALLNNGVPPAAPRLDPCWCCNANDHTWRGPAGTGGHFDVFCCPHLPAEYTRINAQGRPIAAIGLHRAVFLGVLPHTPPHQVAYSQRVMDERRETTRLAQVHYGGRGGGRGARPAPPAPTATPPATLGLTAVDESQPHAASGFSFGTTTAPVIDLFEDVSVAAALVIGSDGSHAHTTPAPEIFRCALDSGAVLSAVPGTHARHLSELTAHVTRFRGVANVSSTMRGILQVGFGNRVCALQCYVIDSLVMPVLAGSDLATLLGDGGTVTAFGKPRGSVLRSEDGVSAFFPTGTDGLTCAVLGADGYLRPDTVTATEANDATSYVCAMLTQMRAYDDSDDEEAPAADDTRRQAIDLAADDDDDQAADDSGEEEAEDGDDDDAERAGEDEAERAGDTAEGAEDATDNTPRHRRRRCNDCEECRRPACGECTNCLNKNNRKSCVLRRCRNMGFRDVESAVPPASAREGRAVRTTRAVAPIHDSTGRELTDAITALNDLQTLVTGLSDTVAHVQARYISRLDLDLTIESLQDTIKEEMEGLKEAVTNTANGVDCQGIVDHAIAPLGRRVERLGKSYNGTAVPTINTLVSNVNDLLLRVAVRESRLPETGGPTPAPKRQRTDATGVEQFTIPRVPPQSVTPPAAVANSAAAANPLPARTPLVHEAAPRSTPAARGSTVPARTPATGRPAATVGATGSRAPSAAVPPPRTGHTPTAKGKGKSA